MARSASPPGEAAGSAQNDGANRARSMSPEAEISAAKAKGVPRGAIHEPVRLNYHLTEDEKVQIMNQQLRPQDVVRNAHALRHGKHKRIAARPAKPSNVPTGWDLRWSGSEKAWYYWCPLTGATCWELSECKHTEAAVQKLSRDKGGPALDSPYVMYTLKADARRYDKDRGRADRIRERRRVQSAGPRRPLSSSGETSLSARTQIGRPQSARVQSTVGSAGTPPRLGPHPPSSSETAIALRSATLSSAATARAAAPQPPASRNDALARAAKEAKEAPWMLGRPADKYGQGPIAPRDAQLWNRKEPEEVDDKKNASHKARTYGRGPGYRKHCMRIDPPIDVHELHDFESKDWRTRKNPGLPREYLHVRPMQQAIQPNVDRESAEQNAKQAIFQEGDLVWLAVDPTATLKNGSCLLQKHDKDDDYHGASSRCTSQVSSKPTKHGVVTMPTGVVKKVLDSSGDCLVEWGVVGHCPLGMPRKLLWCTPSELKKVHKKRMMTAAKSTMIARTMSNFGPKDDTAQRYNLFGEAVNPNGTKGADILHQPQMRMPRPR